LVLRHFMPGSEHCIDLESVLMSRRDGRSCPGIFVY